MAVAQGYQLITFTWVLFSVATVFVGIRLYVQIFFRPRPWREAFIVLAWVMFLMQAIAQSVQNANDSFNAELTGNLRLSLAQIRAINTVQFIGAMTFKPTVYFCKFALLLFYFDLSPKEFFPKTWWAIVVVFGLNVVGCATQWLYVFLTCQPWKGADYLQYSCGLNSAEYFAQGMTFYILTDLLVFLLPIALLRNLTTLDRRQKRVAGVMFAVGSINIATLFPYLYLSIAQRVGRSMTVVTPAWWAMQFFLSIQLFTAVTVVCIPQAKRFCKGMSAATLEKEILVRSESSSFGKISPVTKAAIAMSRYRQNSVGVLTDEALLRVSDEEEQRTITPESSTRTRK